MSKRKSPGVDLDRVRARQSHRVRERERLRSEFADEEEKRAAFRHYLFVVNNLPTSLFCPASKSLEDKADELQEVGRLLRRFDHDDLSRLPANPTGYDADAADLFRVIVANDHDSICKLIRILESDFPSVISAFKRLWREDIRGHGRGVAVKDRDGPTDGKRVRYQGKAHYLGGMPFALLNALWNTRGWELEYPDLNEPLLGHPDQEVEHSQVKDAAKHVNKFCRHHGMPWHISVSAKHLRATLKEGTKGGQNNPF